MKNYLLKVFFLFIFLCGVSSLGYAGTNVNVWLGNGGWGGYAPYAGYGSYYYPPVGYYYGGPYGVQVYTNPSGPFYYRSGPVYPGNPYYYNNGPSNAQQIKQGDPFDKRVWDGASPAGRILP